VNKKKQKNFDDLKHLALIVVNPSEKQQFFASFFQKRSAFCYFRPDSKMGFACAQPILGGPGR
jgi:hypothetical protein